MQDRQEALLAHGVGDVQQRHRIDLALAADIGGNALAARKQGMVNQAVTNKHAGALLFAFGQFPTSGTQAAAKIVGVVQGSGCANGRRYSPPVPVMTVVLEP